MTSEWMKVMLEEIERKKLDAAQARLEEDRRMAERDAATNTKTKTKTKANASDRARG